MQTPSNGLVKYDCKLFFRLDGACNSMVELFNSTGRDFDSTITFNASTGEEYYELVYLNGNNAAEGENNIKYANSYPMK